MKGASAIASFQSLASALGWIILISFYIRMILFSAIEIPLEFIGIIVVCKSQKNWCNSFTSRATKRIPLSVFIHWGGVHSINSLNIAVMTDTADKSRKIAYTDQHRTCSLVKGLPIWHFTKLNFAHFALLYFSILKHSFASSCIISHSSNFNGSCYSHQSDYWALMIP